MEATRTTSAAQLWEGETDVGREIVSIDYNILFYITIFWIHDIYPKFMLYFNIIVVNTDNMVSLTGT